MISKLWGTNRRSVRDSPVRSVIMQREVSGMLSRHRRVHVLQSHYSPATQQLHYPIWLCDTPICTESWHQSPVCGGGRRNRLWGNQAIIKSAACVAEGQLGSSLIAYVVLFFRSNWFYRPRRLNSNCEGISANRCSGTAADIRDMCFSHFEWKYEIVSFATVNF